MAKYQKNLFAMTAKPIPYYKEFREITGSITATILWQQLEFWFSVQEGKPFFKYMEPLKKEMKGYKIGDSWTEELGFSAKEFRAAFAAIGTAYNSKKAFDLEPNPFKDKMYSSYIDKLSHQTFYFRDQKTVERNLSRLPKGISIDSLWSSGKMTKGNPEDTKNTTETNKFANRGKAPVAKKDESSGEPTKKTNSFIDQLPTSSSSVGNNAPAELIPFNSDAYIKQISNDQQKHIKIIGWYFKAIEAKFPSLKAAEADKNRFLKDASILAEYPEDQVSKTVSFVSNKFPNEWKLSTVLKYISKI